jgi:hypothetical protein
LLIADALKRLINAELQNTVLASKAIAGIEAGKLEIRPGLSNVLKAMSRIALSLCSIKWRIWRDPRSDRALISNPQPNPQILMPYTTSAYLGSPRGLLSR